MKSCIFVLFLLFNFKAHSQELIPKDSFVSVLFYSAYQCIDLPLIQHLKGCRDIGVIINIEDADIFFFYDGYCKYYGKINEFEFDSTGRMNLDFTITHKRKVGETLINGELSYTYGDLFFHTLIGKKARKHTKIKYEFHKEQFFNIKFNAEYK
jgi:hypothetical protein